MWCTAAGVQIVRNIVDRKTDHSTANQRRYFNWMRGHNRYDLPVSAGVDPAGWTAGLRHFVDDRYRLVASRTFDSALRSAVKRLRLTNLPVALTVSHGNHGWILTGFRATADPAVTSSFRVTSVRVTGTAVRAPEQERLRHATEHEIDDRAAQALLHAVEVRPQGDDLGRPLRLDPAGAEGGRGCGSAGGCGDPSPIPAAVASPTPVASLPPIPSPSASPAATASAVAAPAGGAVASSAPGGGAGTVTASVSLTGEELVPIWIVLGGVLAIVLIALVAQRARRRTT